MPERDIRKELKKRVEAYGGEVRAVSWLGRRNAPDVLCLFAYTDVHDRAFHCFVETKAPNGSPTDAQEREHKRMRDAGCQVLVISTFDQLDAWLPPLK